MRKFSLKPFLYSVFFLLTAAALSTCLYDPISYKDFTGDPRISGDDGIIGRDAARVFIVTEESCPDYPEYWSDPGLTAGNRRISGLNPDKYYLIEEYVMEEVDEDEEGEGDEEGTGQQSGGFELENTQFVRSNGTRSSSLTNIDKVTGGMITELTNGRWYVVKSATPLEGNVTYYDLAASTNSVGTQQPIGENGDVTLPGTSYYLGLSPAINSIADFTIVKIPISPAGRISTVSRINSNVIPLEGKDTETDYIFFKERIVGSSNTSFYILKVNVSESTSTGITVIVTLTPTSDNSPALTPSQTSYKQDWNGTLTININNNSAQFSDIKWYMDDNDTNPIGTGAQLQITLNNDAIRYRLIGAYTITVTALKDGIPYSAAVRVTVTEP